MAPLRLFAVAPLLMTNWEPVPLDGELLIWPAVPSGIELSPMMTNPAVGPLVGGLRLSFMEPGMSIMWGAVGVDGVG